MSLSLKKGSIRAEMRKLRNELAPSTITESGALAQQRLAALPEFQAAEVVGLYSPIQNELATDQLLKAAVAAKKQVCFPCVRGDDLSYFLCQSLADLEVGSFGVKEPNPQAGEVSLAEVALLLVPGLAFDLQGHRIGYGRGFFDRLFQAGRFSGVSVGFCYDFQVMERLPAEDHDRSVDLLVTDDRLITLG